MVFNSLEFLIFSLLFFILWPIFKTRDNPRWIFITIASLIFYGSWDWRFLFLIIGSGILDFFCGLAISKLPRSRKFFLLISIAGNIGCLSIFKYSVFFAGILDEISLYGGYPLTLSNNIPEFALILPVGISFYTFQSLSYTIDIYKRKLEPVKNIFHFFSYLVMFPQLVAGPIIRARDLIFQLSKVKIVSQPEKWNAIKQIIIGLFQKVVIADNLSFFVDSAFEGKTAYSGSFFWWVVIIAFAFQIYCDFSGYSLIARGIAKYMGYHFKMNFNHPYLARSFKDFWSRWHISLSTWFRDYIYIPLGGNKRGLFMTLFLITFTMVLSGLWHGANYTFLAWGALHAVFLISEKVINTHFNTFIIWKPLRVFFVFMLVCSAWVFFRAESIPQSGEILYYLYNFSISDIGFIFFYINNLIFLILALLIEIIIYATQKSRMSWHRKNYPDLILIPLAILSIVFLRGEGQQFIYFQF